MERKVWKIRGGETVSEKKSHSLHRAQVPTLGDFVGHMTTYLNRRTEAYNPTQTRKRALRWLRSHGVEVKNNLFALEGKYYTAFVNCSQPEFIIEETEEPESQ